MQNQNRKSLQQIGESLFSNKSVSSSICPPVICNSLGASMGSSRTIDPKTLVIFPSGRAAQLSARVSQEAEKEFPVQLLSTMSLDDWRGSITTFDGFTGTTPVLELTDAEWSNISNLLCPEKPAVLFDKKFGQYFVPCTLKEVPLVGNTLDAAIKNGQPTTGKMRSKSHVTKAELIVIDADGLCEDKFLAGLDRIQKAKVAFLAYTTFSHGSVDKPGIRARLVIPVDRLMSIDEYAAAWHGLDSFIWAGQAGKADASGANMYQQQGTWASHPSRIDQAKSWKFEGGTASANELIALGKASQTVNLPQSVVGKSLISMLKAPTATDTPGIVDQTDYPPSDANKIADACKQIGAFRDLKGAAQSEPLWRDCLGVIGYCKDGESLCHAWSAGYSNYNKSETATKLAFRMKTPPTTCNQFKKTNSDGCLGCTQTCNSPITLGWDDAPKPLASVTALPLQKRNAAEFTKSHEETPIVSAVPSVPGKASVASKVPPTGTAQGAPEILALNEKFAFIEENASIYRLEFGNFIDPAKFKLQHDNRLIDITCAGRSSIVSLGRGWLTSVHRRQHRALVIRPAEGRITADNCLNEWTGFATEPSQGNVKPFLRLLVRLVPGRTERRFVQRWMAHLIQHPDIKMFVSMAFWSHVEGVGKNLLVETLVSIIGTTHATVIGQTELTGAFNAWANRRILVVGDEVSGNDKRQETDKLKGLITGTTVHINEKYQPDREQPNLLNFIFLSNHHDALFLNDHDRRFFILEVEAGRLPEALANRFVQWRDNGGLSALHYFLLNYPLGEFNPKAPAPMTTAKRQMADDNRSDLEAWLADLMASDVAVVLGRELATANEIGRYYQQDTGHNAPSSKAIVGACKRQGAIARVNQVRLKNGSKIRPLALAKPSYWKTQPEAEWAAEMGKAFVALSR